MPLRFHWMMPKGGEVGMSTVQETSRVATTMQNSPAAMPDIEGWLRFANSAETAGIESVLLSFSRYEPDTLLIATALGFRTQRLKFIVAYRLGLMQAPTFVQQINTLSSLISGRVALNIVAGSSTAEQRGYGDFLDHDQRYERADEFLEICRDLWEKSVPVTFEGKYCHVERSFLNTQFESEERSKPEIYVSGHSEQAQHLALNHASSWLRLADSPEKLSPIVRMFKTRGVEVSLRLCVICRPSRKAALDAALKMFPDEKTAEQERKILTNSDSQTLKQALDAADTRGWLTENLWAGLVPYYGSSSITLLGSPEEIASALLEFGRIGISQFIISGWPKLEEMEIFGNEVLPLIRRAEAKKNACP